MPDATASVDSSLGISSTALISVQAMACVDNSLLSCFICVKCRSSELAIEPTDQANDSGQDITCRNCKSQYPTKKGVPRFVSNEQYVESFGFQWNRFRRTQLDSYTKLPISEGRLFLVTQWPRDLTGHTVLEAGSGAGRFTEVLLTTGATVYSFDLSNAVEANFQNNGSAKNLCLFQASIHDIPLRRASFDKILCLGVLQHTPDPETSFRKLTEFLKPGGEIVVDVYARNWQSMISWKYILRPITTRLPKHLLFRIVEGAVALFLKPSIVARTYGGKVGARLFPILQYCHWGLPLELNRDWAVLDTFDMYSPVHDHPKTMKEVREWYSRAGLCDVHIGFGPNGVIARGRAPLGER